ncbi:uncharacterized protein LOC110702077 [Chenopodium quinoa]|nr:uncharacterized protein LOC110702077 [Chenopodium quinoa]
MDFGRRRENGNGNGYGGGSFSNGNSYGNGNCNGNGNGLMFDRFGFEERECGDGPIIADSFKVSSSSTNSSSPSSSSSSPSRYIEHYVTKLDTLAGVAIRYGVEVADIKKLNGLVTDLQMFALKTLYIPLPGRHPPSPCLSNGHSTAGPSSSEQTPSRRVRPDVLESFQTLRITPEYKVSPAMSSLRGYYGLNEQKNSSDGFEMALYSKGSTSYGEDERSFTSPSLMNPPLSQHRRSRSVANGFKTEEDDLSNDMDNAAKWIDNLNKRRQKSDADFARTPGKLLKEENGSGGWFSAITGKGLALRTKAASRTSLASEAEAGGSNGFLFSLGDSNAAESSSGVRKSSSTPSFQDQDGSSSSSIWSAAKWSLTPELQAALTKPIFDGLPKPISGRKSKAALD